MTVPNRVLREGILTSLRVDQLSDGAELFYRRLMSVVDDYGRWHAHATMLRARLYPLRVDRITDQMVEGWLAECHSAGLVQVYSEHWIDCVFSHSKARMTSRLVALALAYHADESGKGTVSCGALAKDAGLLTDSFRRATRELTKLGELTINNRGGGRGERKVKT